MNQQQQQQRQTADGHPGHGNNNSVGQQQAQQHLPNQSFITNTHGHNLSSQMYLQPSPLQYIYQLAPNMLASIQTSNNTLLQLPNTSSVALPANIGREQNSKSRGIVMSPQQPSITTTAQGQTIGGFKTPDRFKFAQSPASSSPILIPQIQQKSSPLMNQFPIMVGSNRIQIIQPNQLNQLNQPDSFVIQSPLGPTQIYLNPSALPVAMNNTSPIISLATSQSHTAPITALTNATQGMTGQMIETIPTSVPLSIQSTAPTQSLAVAPSPSIVSTATRPRQIKPAQILANVGTQTAKGTSDSNTSTSATSTTSTPQSGPLKTIKNAKLPLKSQADRVQKTIHREILPSQGCVSGQGSQTINVHAFPNQSNDITIPHLSHSNTRESRPHHQMNKDNEVTVTLVSQTKTKAIGTNKPPGERLRGRPPTNKFPSNGVKERNEAKSNFESRDAFAGDNMERADNFVDPIRENGIYLNCEHFFTPINHSNKLSLEVAKEVAPKLPQKAIVKPFLDNPNFLTHVIDGYIIQESPSPFPPMDHNNNNNKSENDVADSRDESTNNDPTEASPSSSPRPESDSCENCGKVGIIKMGGKKKKQKRFCSKMCAFKFNDLKKSQKLANEAQNISNTRESEPPPDYPMDDTEGIYIPAGDRDPRLWSIEDVCEFVRNIPGCQECADEFKSHEIDGQALKFLNEKNLVETMCIKLGPALKIDNRIKALFKAETSESQA